MSLNTIKYLDNDDNILKIKYNDIIYKSYTNNIVFHKYNFITLELLLENLKNLSNFSIRIDQYNKNIIILIMSYNGETLSIPFELITKYELILLNRLTDNLYHINHKFMLDNKHFISISSNYDMEKSDNGKYKKLYYDGDQITININDFYIQLGFANYNTQYEMYIDCIYIQNILCMDINFDMKFDSKKNYQFKFSKYGYNDRYIRYDKIIKDSKYSGIVTILDKINIVDSSNIYKYDIVHFIFELLQYINYGPYNRIYIDYVPNYTVIKTDKIFKGLFIYEDYHYIYIYHIDCNYIVCTNTTDYIDDKSVYILCDKI